MMKSNLIVMLTHNDKTVHNALDVFESCKDLPVNYWGFKDVDLPKNEMRELIKVIKDAGKTSFLEVVSYTKDECLAGAEFAVDFGFDFLMGTLFFPEVWDFLKKKEIKYSPFVGQVSGSPSVLEGTVDSMVEETVFLDSQGVHGVDLLAFRHKENPEKLAAEFISRSKVPVILAGSIDSFERIDFVNKVDPWGFTMGSALFTKNFLPEGSFRQNLEAVIKKMESID
jgi:hypothetical protein